MPDDSHTRANRVGILGRDLLHAVRTLAKARTFTAVCVTSLGLGMGTVIVILLTMRAAFGTPAAVKTDGLVELVITPIGPLRAAAGSVVDTWSYPDFTDLRDGNTGMAITGWTFGESLLRLSDRAGVTRVPTMYISSNYFKTVGVALARRPGFDAIHDTSNAPPVVIVGYGLWQRLGANPAIIGSTIEVNRVLHVVVGIAPERYVGHVSEELGPDVQIWLPLERHPRLQGSDNARFNRSAPWLRLLGRLSPGTGIAQATGAVSSIMSGLAARYPTSNQFKRGAVEAFTGTGARMKLEILATRVMFLGFSGMVLLLVCLNTCGMMLVRSAMRERELAIRLALGASRARLVQYLLSEAVVLSLLGGSLGAALIFGVPAAALALGFNVLPSSLDALRPDAWIAAQCVGLAFVTSLVFGLLPAMRFSRPWIVSALKDDRRGGPQVSRFHRLVAAAQAGIAAPFFVIGGVRLDQARVTAMADLGFKPHGIFAAPLDLTAEGRAEDGARLFQRAVHDSLAYASGVESVTFADGLPLDFTRRVTEVSREGNATYVPAHMTRVAPGYLETLGTRLLRGRDVRPGDYAGAELVVMISKPLATHLFATRDPLGERVTFALEGREKQVFTVVGVTADVVTSQMGEPRPQLFVPLAQHQVSNVLVIVRSSAPEAAIRPAFERAITKFDRDFVPTSIVTGDELVRRSRSDLLLHATLGGGAGAIALVLAALGVYGVVAFVVATRTREIGVRIALGASRGRVLREVLVDSLKLVVPGVGGGLVLAIFWVRVADPSWYPLGGVEPLIYLVATVTAFFVALLSGIPSARRAAAVEPIVAMRTE